MATIDNNNLPKGVTLIYPGKYLVTNSKGQSRTVYPDTATQLNQYNDSWQTGKPTTITGIVNPNDGRIMPPMQFNPADIIGQEQATSEYQANLTKLKRADLLPNKDGTYSSRTTGAVLTDAEIQQKIAAAGLPPNTLEIQKNNGKFNPSPPPATVEESTAAVNNVTNIPSGGPPAPAPPETGTLSSPLTVDPQLGATIVKEEPNVAQAAAVTEVPVAKSTGTPYVFPDERGGAGGVSNAVPVAKSTGTPYVFPDERGGAGGVSNAVPVAKKQPQDADPEGTANIQEQNARPQKQVQDADPEGNANVEEQYAKPQKQPQDADPEGTANIQEQNAAANEEAIRNAGETPQGLTTAKLNTQSQATQQDAVNFQAKQDWRVRLSLSPGATYLYKASLPGILAPLQATDGVIFPYTPAISVQYTAGYDPTELTHSNYKFFTYKGSAVDNVTIGCDFTAQDTFEAQYVLAVIHFFKSITKMFYGQDQNPTNGTPPPLCYLTGLGAFQFDTHPLVVTAFTYTLPTDVDYIQAGSNFAPAGVNTAGSQSKQDPFADAQSRRLASNALNPGATVPSPNWQTTNVGTKDATYVPTKISISISAFPIITRNDISNTFSLREYATGALLRGSKRAGGGIW